MIIINQYRFAQSASVPFITGWNTGAINTRNDYSDYIGFQFTVSTPIYVTALGRWSHTTHAATHNLKITTNVYATVKATVTVDASLAATGTYAIGSVTPVLLTVGDYNMLSLEVNGGDNWIEINTITHTGVATIPDSSFVASSTLNGGGQGANHSYGSVNFWYYLA